MSKTYIIAEAGVNHNGSIDLAKNLIEAASKAGADAVKFQAFSADRLASNSAQMAEYQIKNTGLLEPQIDMLRRLELSKDDFIKLKEYCNNFNIVFMCSPFDMESIQMLVNELDLQCIKIPSGEITNGPFLLKIGQSMRSVILSTGMSTLEEIEQALDVLAYGYLNKATPQSFDDLINYRNSSEGSLLLKEKVQLLHCTTEYPAPIKSINLRAMTTMNEAFGLPIGYSDHSEGIAVSIAAVAQGAVIIEKHLTLDQSMLGPDHKASIEPGLFSEMVLAIRVVEKALGNGQKKPHKIEIKNKQIARKKLVARQVIKSGDKLSGQNMTAMRPGDGISPMRFWDLINRPANQKYIIGEPIRDD